MANETETENRSCNLDAHETTQSQPISEEESETSLRRRVIFLEQVVELQNEQINALELFKSQCTCQTDSSQPIYLVINDFENGEHGDLDSERIMELLNCEDVEISSVEQVELGNDGLVGTVHEIFEEDMLNHGGSPQPQLREECDIQSGISIFGLDQGEETVIGVSSAFENTKPRTSHKFPKQKCHICNKKYKTEEFLRKHLKLHKFYKIYKCRDCQKRFFNLKSFHLHKIDHLDHKPVKCYLCSSTLQNIRKLKLHMKSHPPSDFELLGMTWKLIYQLSLPPNKLKSPPNTKFCGKAVRSSSHYISRRQIHQKKLKRIWKSLRTRTTRKCIILQFFKTVGKCEDATTKQKKNRNGGASLEESFECIFCSKIFKNHNRMLKHERLHKRGKRFQCTMCSKSFAQRRQPEPINVHAGNTKLTHRGVLSGLCAGKATKCTCSHTDTDLEIGQEKLFGAKGKQLGGDEERKLSTVGIKVRPMNAAKNSSLQQTEFVPVVTIPDSDSEPSTITDGEHSVNDFEDEDESPSPNLGNQAPGNFPDLQDELDFQELTLAKNSFNSNGNNCSGTEISPAAELTAKDKCDLLQFIPDIEAVLTTEVCTSSAFFPDENEIPNLEGLADAINNKKSNQGAQTEGPIIDTYSVTLDMNLGAPFSEISVQVGGKDETVQFGKQYKLIEQSGRLQCPICEKPLQTKHDLEIHIVGHNAIPSFPCRGCNETFKTKACLISHEKFHGPGIHTKRRKRKFQRRGPRCDSNPTLKLDGIQENTSEDESILMPDEIAKTPTVFKDEIICNFTYCGKNLGGLDSACYRCSRRFRSNRNFQAHQSTHLGQRPFHCNICHVRFRDLLTLNEHINQEHTFIKASAKKFQCYDCSGYYLTFENKIRPIVDCRQRAARKIETILNCQFAFCGNPNNELQLDYECFQCDKTCETIEFLRMHEEIHSGDLPFPCNICGKCFGEIVNLKDHIHETHKTPIPNWKMFNCKTCDSSNHVRTVHKKILRTYSSKGSKRPFGISPSSTIEKSIPELTVKCTPENYTNVEYIQNQNPLTISGTPIIRLDEVMDMAGITAEMHTVEGFTLKNHKDEVNKINSSINGDTEVPMNYRIPESLKCPDCGLEHLGRRCLNRHLEVHRAQEGTSPAKLQHSAQCPFCDKFYKYAGVLKKHVEQTHNRRDISICHLCSKVFEWELFDKHIRTFHEIMQPLSHFDH